MMANFHPYGVAGEVAGHVIPLRGSIYRRFLRKTPFAHFVILPNSQEVEAMPVNLIGGARA